MQLQPTEERQRIDFIDILRGLTIGGILFANILLFNGYHNSPLSIKQQMIMVSTLDHWSLLFIKFFIHGKFYYLFSFLFGVGFGLQLARATARDSQFLPVFLRRLFWLLVFGMLHAYLLYYGDIIRFYAVLGVALCAFRKITDRWLLFGALICLVLPILLRLIQAFLIPEVTLHSLSSIDKAYLYQAYTEGSFSELLPVKWQQMVDHAIRNLWNGRVCKIFGMFLLGYYFARRRLLSNLSERHAFYRRLAFWGAGLGIGFGLIRLLLDYYPDVLPQLYAPIIKEMVYFIAVPAMSLAYLAALVLLFNQARWQRYLSYLAPAGRMAFTHYVGQSVFCALIFYPFALGYYGQLPLFTCLLIALLIYSGQLLISHLWLRHFRFGPLEWLWRSLTYRKWQPLRMPSSAQPSLN